MRVLYHMRGSITACGHVLNISTTYHMQGLTKLSRIPIISIQALLGKTLIVVHTRTFMSTYLSTQLAPNPSLSAPDLSPIPRQLRPQHRARMDPPIRPIVEVRLIHQLIDVPINIPVLRHARRVRPNDPRIPHKRLRPERGRVVRENRVLPGDQLVDQPVAIPFKPIRRSTSLAEVPDVAGCVFGRAGAGVIAEVGCFDGVEVVACQRGVVHGASVGRELDAVDAFLDVAELGGAFGGGVGGDAEVAVDEALHGAGARVEV